QRGPDGPLLYAEARLHADRRQVPRQERAENGPAVALLSARSEDRADRRPGQLVSAYRLRHAERWRMDDQTSAAGFLGDDDGVVPRPAGDEAKSPGVLAQELGRPEGAYPPYRAWPGDSRRSRGRPDRNDGSTVRYRNPVPGKQISPAQTI